MESAGAWSAEAVEWENSDLTTLTEDGPDQTREPGRRGMSLRQSRAMKGR
jgi:hypothetical protein